MKNGLFAKLLPHLIAFVVFLLVALIYCKPALEGKVLQQHDVVQWKAMAQNSFEYQEKYGKLPLWTNGMFSGMPAYQIAMESDTPVSPGIFYTILTLGLPKPISFFFLACVCFYLLSLVLRLNPYVGIIGSLAFAYATYNPVIIVAGHETKMNTIAFMPALIGSLLLIYERKYWLGGALTALFTCLLVGMNHFQIAYYTVLIIGFMTIGYMVHWIQQKQFKHLALALGIALAAGVTGVMCNAVNILTTSEYAKATIRGGSALPSQTNTSTKDGLSKEYALSYSMYKTEPFVMLVPHIFGGSNSLEVAEEDSKAIATLQQMPQEIAQQLQYNLGAYWGGIGGTSGPPYVGAIICFLTLIGFFILDNKHKWWILAASLLAIVMSWGEYFLGFNTFLLENLPFYNKFRAPSMTIVIPTFLFCMMAVLTLQKIISWENKQELWDRYKKGLLLTAGVFALLFFFYISADFHSEGDKNLLTQTASAPPQAKDYIRIFLEALADDRKGLFLGSLFRSFFFIAAAALILWLMIRKNISKFIVLGGVGLLAFIDVMGIDTKYLSSEQYKEETEYQTAFTPSPADVEILKDTSYYRVLDTRQGLSVALGMQGALPSYFHLSVGGYHPAKLSIYQDLIEHQLSKFPQSLPVFNMLNTKYIIQKDQQGQDQVIPNPDALGAAWFVKAIRFEETPAAVMNALNNFSPADTAVVFTKDKAVITAPSQSDSAASVRLIANRNDEVLYESNAAANGFVVFSEVYYDKGWKAFIDGKETPIVRTNYVLRGLTVPAGKHQIRFVFHPTSFYTGETIATIASILVFLALIAAAVVFYRNRKKEVKAVHG
ncbi:MAG TPA: YfhO family protein [Flavisolibacter sp.]